MARKPGKKHEETIKLFEQGALNNEIAKTLGLPMATVKSRRRAWKKLIKDFNPRWNA